MKDLFTDVDTRCRLSFDPLLSLHVEVVHIEDVQKKLIFFPAGVGAIKNV